MLRSGEGYVDSVDDFQETDWGIAGKVSRVSDERDDHNFCFFALESIDGAQSDLQGVEKDTVNIPQDDLHVSQFAHPRKPRVAVPRPGARAAPHLAHRERR